MIEHYLAAWDELLQPGSLYEMTDVEVRGIPMRVFAKAPPSMRVIWELARNHGDRRYVVFEDEQLTYAEVDARVRALAHHLRDAHGVGPGDRVAVAMRNYPEWVVSHWAITAVGAAVVGMNAWWTAPEMAYALDDSKPKVLIADTERVARAEGSAVPIIAVRHEGDLPPGAVHWDDAVRPDEAPADLPPADIDPDDDATIFYTSGTTGFPKGAQLTHRGSVHNVLHCAFMVQVAAAANARAVAAGDVPAPPPRPDLPTVTMAPTPLFHVTANNCLLQPTTLAGGTVVFLYRWDPARALEIIERERVTSFSGVPTMSRELLAHPDWHVRDVSSLGAMGGGGAALQPDLVGKIDTSLRGRGGSPSTGYGLTETSGIVSANGGVTYLARPNTVGPAVPTLDAKVVDEDGSTLPAGERGSLLVRGPIVIKGYLNKPEATAEAIRDGWFDTGDIACIDEAGFISIVDRAKDMVLRGGENVYCSEVEAAIYALPGIAEAAVFGIPEERLGEAVAVAVVLEPGVVMTADDLRAGLADRLATHKLPTTVWFLDRPLPRNANGKFLKRQLRDELVQG